MKRKFYILLLIFTFGISNTGLPLVYHFCSMQSEYSFSVCKMCGSHKEVKKCCAEKEAPVTIHKDNSKVCCDEELVVKPIESQFVPLKVVNDNVDIIAVAIIPEETPSTNNGKTLPALIPSPPKPDGRQINLINSIFLI